MWGGECHGCHDASTPTIGRGRLLAAVLPTFTPGKPSPSGDDTPDRPRGRRTFRTLDVTSADALSGTRAQAQDVGDRLRGARWTLQDDGTLTADRAEVPVLHSTSGDATTRVLTGRRTVRTDVGATTTWVEARLVMRRGPDGPARPRPGRRPGSAGRGRLPGVHLHVEHRPAPVAGPRRGVTGVLPVTVVSQPCAYVNHGRPWRDL